MWYLSCSDCSSNKCNTLQHFSQTTEFIISAILPLYNNVHFRLERLGYFFGRAYLLLFYVRFFNTMKWCRAKKVHPLHLCCLLRYLNHNRTMTDNRAFLLSNNSVTMTTSRRTLGQKKKHWAWGTRLIKKWNNMVTITLMSEREATHAFRHLWHRGLNAFSISCLVSCVFESR